MQVLLCAATEMEIAPTIQALSLKEGHSVEFLITGVGLTACTYALTKEVVTKRPDAIIQAGVAGSMQLDQPLAQVVAVKSETIGDLGVKEGGFLSLFDLKLLSPNTQPWQEGKLTNPSEILQTAGLPLVDGVTVNEISTSDERIDYYRDQLNAQVESMEGAALHYIGLMEKIPFLQVRSLSNFIGERDKNKWMMKESITKLNQTIQRILTKLEAL
ncbi:MAG TPA: futalosine hydrolase [Flavisolibacter sp.]